MQLCAGNRMQEHFPNESREAGARPRRSIYVLQARRSAITSLSSLQALVNLFNLKVLGLQSLTLTAFS